MKTERKLKFKCKAKIVEAVEKNHIFKAPVKVEKPVSQLDVEKPRRLRFKKSKNIIVQPDYVPPQRDEEDHSTPDAKNDGLLLREEIIHNKINYIPEMYEYGPGINGYQYIAFNREDIPDMDERSTLSESTDCEIEESVDVEFKESPFESYLYQWRDIISGKSIQGVPIPVRSGLLKDVNVGNVKEFLYSKPIVKLERIRWHPDKMRILLKNGPQLDDEDITHVFQTINSVYENWDQ